MTTRFVARAVAAEADPDLDLLRAGVAEGEDGSGFVLMFLSGIEPPDPQDVALGLDTYCVVTAGQGTAHACVREVALTDRLLTVSLDPEALDALGLDDAEVEARLDAAPGDVERLREVLPRVLGFGRADARPRRVDVTR